MKKIGDLMRELGFRPESSVDTQKSFIRHLIDAANAAQFQRKNETQNNQMAVLQKPKSSQTGEQLSFDFTDVSTGFIDKDTKTAG